MKRRENNGCRCEAFVCMCVNNGGGGPGGGAAPPVRPASGLCGPPSRAAHVISYAITLSWSFIPSSFNSHPRLPYTLLDLPGDGERKDLATTRSAQAAAAEILAKSIIENDLLPRATKLG